MAKKFLRKYPEFSTKEKPKVGDLVAIVTKVFVPEPSILTEIYIGRLVSEYIYSGDNRIDNVLKLNMKHGNYNFTEVDTITTPKPAYPLTENGINYLKRNLPKNFKNTLRL